MLVLCSSVFAEITPTSTSNSGSVYTKGGKISIGSSKDKDKTPQEIQKESEKEKTEEPKINAIQNMFDMKGKIAHDRGGGAGTNCAWTVAWSYKGTPYGQVSDFRLFLPFSNRHLRIFCMCFFLLYMCYVLISLVLLFQFC